MALPEGANDEPQGVYRKRMRHGGKSCPTRRDQVSSDLPGFRRNALPAGQDTIRYELFHRKRIYRFRKCHSRMGLFLLRIRCATPAREAGILCGLAEARLFEDGRAALSMVCRRECPRELI